MTDSKSREDFLKETAGVNVLFVTSNSYYGAMFRPKAAQGYHGVPIRDGQGRKVTRIFAKMARRMFRNMATNLNHTLDEPTATYLEKVAWEEYQAV
jgi:hypothetical protein